MAEAKTQEKQDEKTNPGTPDPATFETADTALAAGAGITEGEVKALRDDAGLNALAGSESDIHAWSLTEEGKAHAKAESDRKKAYDAEAKSYKEQFDKDGLNPADKAYAEAVKKAK